MVSNTCSWLTFDPLNLKQISYFVPRCQLSIGFCRVTKAFHYYCICGVRSRSYHCVWKLSTIVELSIKLLNSSPWSKVSAVVSLWCSGRYNDCSTRGACLHLNECLYSYERPLTKDHRDGNGISSQRDRPICAGIAATSKNVSGLLQLLFTACV